MISEVETTADGAIYLTIQNPPTVDGFLQLRLDGWYIAPEYYEVISTDEDEVATVRVPYATLEKYGLLERRPLGVHSASFYTVEGVNLAVFNLALAEDEKEEPVNYEINGAGASGEWMIGKLDNTITTDEIAAGKDLVFHIEAPLAEFETLEIDGGLVSKEYYTATQGSTVITLKNAYLKRLGVGKHALQANFAAGVAAMEFEIVEGNNGGESAAAGAVGLPNTGAGMPAVVGTAATVSAMVLVPFVALAGVGVYAYRVLKK